MMNEQPQADVFHPSYEARRPGEYVHVDTHPLGDHLLLVVAGEADHFTAESLRAELIGALTPATRSVAVDVSRLRFCDLAGLDALDGFAAEARSRQMAWAIHGMSPLLTRLRELFPPIQRWTVEVGGTGG